MLAVMQVNQLPYMAEVAAVALVPQVEMVAALLVVMVVMVFKLPLEVLPHIMLVVAEEDHTPTQVLGPKVMVAKVAAVKVDTVAIILMESNQPAVAAAAVAASPMDLQVEMVDLVLLLFNIPLDNNQKVYIILNT
tara:strand:- start:57 stop:461 length:405 start_codon:yes stop_codon:yes gene_type:complete